MSRNIKCDCITDVIITDNSLNAEAIVKNINDQKILNKAIYAEVKKIDEPGRGKINAFIDVMSATFGRSKYLRHKLGNTYYDELIFYTQNMFTYIVYAYISNINPDVKVSRFEEGVTSYNLSYHMGWCQRTRLLYRCRNAINKSFLDNYIENFYCMYPDLYKGGLRKIEIPIYKCDELFVEKINSAFGVEKIEEIEEKFIFLSTSHDLEKTTSINERTIIEEVSEKVGKENFTVKVHPRVIPNELIDMGVHVIEKSYIPWEVFLLNSDFEKHVILTSISGGGLSVGLTKERGPDVLFMYSLMDISQNERVRGMIAAFEELYDNYNCVGLKRVIKIKNIDEVMQYVK